MQQQQHLVLVHLGGPVPPHLISNLKHLRRLWETYKIGNRVAITLISDSVISDSDPTAGVAEHVTPESLALEASEELTFKMSAYHRATAKVEPFWRQTTERFFWIEQWMSTRGVQNVVHIENDVLLFANPAKLADKFQSLFRNRMALVFDNDQRCVASLAWFPSVPVLAMLTSFVNNSLDSSCGFKNDMQLLAEFGARMGPEVVASLPIVTPEMSTILRTPSGVRPERPQRYSACYDDFEGVFDACCLGQWLGGTHQNPVGGTFVNETSYLDPSTVQFSFKKIDEGCRIPVASFATGETAEIHCLHIHSKILDDFRFFSGALE